jgi:predicted acetyltransferase
MAKFDLSRYRRNQVQQETCKFNFVLFQVLFHASTMMPNTRADHEFKKKRIGNDYVIIVYNESDYSLDMKTLKVCQAYRLSRSFEQYE